MWGLAFQPATRVRTRGESVGRLGIQSRHASFIVGDRVEVHLRIRKRTDHDPWILGGHSALRRAGGTRGFLSIWAPPFPLSERAPVTR